MGQKTYIKWNNVKLTKIKKNSNNKIHLNDLENYKKNNNKNISIVNKYNDKIEKGHKSQIIETNDEIFLRKWKK